MGGEEGVASPTAARCAVRPPATRLRDEARRGEDGRVEDGFDARRCKGRCKRRHQRRTQHCENVHVRRGRHGARRAVASEQRVQQRPLRACRGLDDVLHRRLGSTLAVGDGGGREREEVCLVRQGSPCIPCIVLLRVVLLLLLLQQLLLLFPAPHLVHVARRLPQHLVRGDGLDDRRQRIRQCGAGALELDDDGAGSSELVNRSLQGKGQAGRGGKEGRPPFPPSLPTAGLRCGGHRRVDAGPQARLGDANAHSGERRRDERLGLDGPRDGGALAARPRQDAVQKLRGGKREGGGGGGGGQWGGKNYEWWDAPLPARP